MGDSQSIVELYTVISQKMMFEGHFLVCGVLIQPRNRGDISSTT